MLREDRTPRWIAIASAGCVVAGAIACGSEATVEVSPEPVPLAAPPTTLAADVEPAHGGTVMMAGDYPVEIVPHASGQVYAYVLGDPPPIESTELTVVVPVAGGVRTVELAWEPGETRWGGRVRHAEIVVGPIDLVLVVGGARYLGHVTTFVLLPAIVIVEPASSVVVIEHDHHEHRKHRKHRGHWH